MAKSLRRTCRGIFVEFQKPLLKDYLSIVRNILLYTVLYITTAFVYCPDADRSADIVA